MFCTKCGANVAAESAFCNNCGQPVAGTPSAVPAAAPTATSPLPQAVPPAFQAPQYAATAYPGQAAPATVFYAGFWLRVVAAIIDGLIIGIPVMFLMVLLFASSLPTLMHNPDPITIIFTFLPRILLIILIALIGSWIYFGRMESSSWQATLGKKALGLYVTDMWGRPATFGRTSGRFWAGRGLANVPYLGGLYFLISCICAGLTERKQALHDMIAGCLVLRKS